MDIKKESKKLIDCFETQEECAKAMGVEQSTVSGWLTGAHGMSEFNALYAEVVTNGAVKAEKLNAKVKRLKVA